MPSVAAKDSIKMRENGANQLQQQQQQAGPAAAVTSDANAQTIGEAGNNSTPLRQGITVIEHKIRNLEKRKAKLESYRDLQKSGKDLNADQKTAVAKYDEVVQTLEFARDLAKQFMSIALVTEKEEKKRARKEALLRSQAELTKIREVLLVQDALTCLGQEVIREDFLHGRNGATQLTTTDIKLLDDLYTVVTPKHEAGDPTSFMPQVQAAAEHLLAVVDGKPKEVFGSTYAQVKEVIGKIHESGYLDQATESFEEVEAEEVAATNIEEVAPICEGSESIKSMQQVQNRPPLVGEPTPVMAAIPPMALQQQITAVPGAPVPPEHLYYNTNAGPPQNAQVIPPPQARPITDVLGKSSFLFLQESEIDTPAEQIPTQTYTNQAFVATAPPPMPMPHTHFQQFPNGPVPPPQTMQQHQTMQQTVPTQNIQPSGGPTVTTSVAQISQPPPPSQPQLLHANNGIGDHQHDDSSRQNQTHQPSRGGNSNGRHQPPQRSNNTTHHHHHHQQQQQQQQQHHSHNQQQHQQQPFYSNNNRNNNNNGNNRHRMNGPRPRNNN